MRTSDAPSHENQRKRSTSLWRCSALAWPFLASGMLNVSTVTIAPWFPGRTHKPATHHQWSRCSGIRGRCLRSPAYPARLPDGVASTPSLAASAWISRTLSAWPKHRPKWNVPNQCLSPAPPQGLEWWHDGPAWQKSTLGQWARHFGL